MAGEQALQELNQRRLKLIEDIRIAFDGVALGDGIGPYEALALEDWVDEDSEEYQIAKKKDQEIGEWYGPNISFISESDIMIFCFGDTKGQIFALPAIMTGRLTKSGRKNGGDYIAEDVFQSLTLPQQKVVAEYINLLNDAYKYTRKSEFIDSIKNLWKSPLTMYEKLLLFIGGAGIILYLLFGMK